MRLRYLKGRENSPLSTSSRALERGTSTLVMCAALARALTLSQCGHAYTCPSRSAPIDIVQLPHGLPTPSSAFLHRCKTQTPQDSKMFNFATLSPSLVPSYFTPAQRTGDTTAVLVMLVFPGETALA